MKFSIIIISLNEGIILADKFTSFREASKLSSGKQIPIEIIVSDGGSKDKTFEIAYKMADKVINSPMGRSNQLNSGALAASGDIFIFSHADTFFPKDGFLKLYESMKSSKILGGGFSKNCMCHGGCASRRAILGNLDTHDEYYPHNKGEEIKLEWNPAPKKHLVRSANCCTTIVQ